MARKIKSRSAVVSAMAKAGSTELSPARIYRAEEVVPSDILPTGHDNLDIALGIGGSPMGRLITLYGPPQCGKCLPEDTYLFTGYGLLTLGELFRMFECELGTIQKTEPREVRLVNGRGDAEYTSHFTWNNVRPVFQVEAEDGTVVRSTANHPHMVMGEAGFHVWRKTKDIKPGDHLVLAPKGDYGWDKIPVDRAYALGILTADAHYGDIRVSVTNDDPHVQECLRQDVATLVGVEPKEYPAGGSVDFHFNSKEKVAAFYKEYGLEPGLAKDKVVPYVIRTSQRSVVFAFLRGYIDCEGHCNGKTLEVASASHRLLIEVKHLLQINSIFATIKDKVVGGKKYWRLFLTGGDLRRYMDEVGTDSRDWELPETTSYSRDVVPHVEGLCRALYDASETTRLHASFFSKVLFRRPTRANLQYALLNVDWGAHPLAKHLWDVSQYKYVKVTSVESAGEVPTYDVVMPESHSFVAEGVVTHNTTWAIEQIREAQYRGGIGIYFDFENKLEIPYVEQLGVDMDFFIHDCPGYIEEAMEKTEEYLKVLRAEDERAPVVFIWDSVSDAKSKAVFEGKWDKNNWANEARVYGTHLSRYARMISGSNALVIGIAQKRMTMKGQIAMDKVGPGNCWLHKNCVVLSWVDKDKQKGKVSGPVGEVSTIEVSKNQVGVAWRKVELLLEYGVGYDQEFSTFKAALAAGVVTKSGSWYSIGEDRIGQGKEKVIELLRSKPKLLKKIRTHLRAGFTAKIVGYEPEELEGE